MDIQRYFRLALMVTCGVLFMGSSGRAAENARPPSVVTRYCSGCHGIDGKSRLPYIPRLSGLSAAYMNRKVAHFRSAASSPVDEAFQRITQLANGSKENAFTPTANAHMVGTTHAVSEQELNAAVVWYASQRPEPGKSSKRDVMEQGRVLYTQGLQSRSIPACQTCHGAEAQGNGTTPRLAGQNAAYVFGQLAFFRSDGGQGSPMKQVARNLGDDQARAVAAYLQAR